MYWSYPALFWKVANIILQINVEIYLTSFYLKSLLGIIIYTGIGHIKCLIFLILSVTGTASFQTLFHTLPRLSLLNDDEWIAPHYFSAYPKACYISLLNPDPSLAKCEERTRHLRGKP